MTIRQKQKRSDDPSTARSQSTTPIAEAVALGTAAGGLVIGALQAQADDRVETDAGHGPRPLAERSSEHPSDGLSKHADTTDVAHEIALVQTQVAAHDDVLTVPVAMTPEVSQTTGIGGDAPAPALASVPESDVVSNSTPLAPVNDVAHDLAGQITASLTKAIEGAGAGTSTADLGLSIANDIVQSAQHIVANLELGSITGLAQSIIAEINPQSIVQDVVAQTSQIAEGLLSGVSDIPATVLADVADRTAATLDGIGALANTASLADLPSSILGNEGPEGPGGMLSDVFYPDGAADSLSIPDLSLAASSLLPAGGGDALGFLGVSYVDMPMDHHGPGLGLNALSIL